MNLKFSIKETPMLSDRKEMNNIQDKTNYWIQIKSLKNSFLNLANSSKNNKTLIEISKISMARSVDRQLKELIVYKMSITLAHIEEAVIRKRLTVGIISKTE